MSTNATKQNSINFQDTFYQNSSSFYTVTAHADRVYLMYFAWPYLVFLIIRQGR